MYVDTDVEFQAISIISSPAHHHHREQWRVGQLRNRLSRGPEAIRFNREDICCSIVVPMQEPYAKELGLLHDSSQIISVDNCRFWDNFDPEKDFAGDGELCMVTLPRAFPYSQGTVVSQPFDELLNSIESAVNKPPILNGKPTPGVADALRALKKNEFNSFFWQG